jgi:hypothetical protein
MTMNKYVLVFLLAVMAGGNALAASLRVSFEVPYEAAFFSDKPSDEQRRKALTLAKEEVWKSYLGRQDSSTLSMVEKNKDAFTKRLDEIVTGIDILDEQVNKEARRIKYTVRAVVNDNIVSSIISSANAGAKTGEGSPFGFFIMPRLQSDANSFDATVAKKATATTKMVTESFSADQVKETDGGASERNISGDKVSMSMSAKTSGSTVRKAQQVKWKLGDAKDVDATISKYLTESGYEPESYADTASECGTVKTQVARQDMLESDTGEFSDEVRSKVFAAVKECKLRFFAVGTLDIDSIEQDRNTGGVRARASVNIQVYEIKEAGRPRKVASVGPVDYYGVGPQEDGARSDALRKSAKEATLVIVNQLRSKGLQ